MKFKTLNLTSYHAPKGRRGRGAGGGSSGKRAIHAHLQAVQVGGLGFRVKGLGFGV